MEYLIHMTAAYSNALFMLVVTNASDFAKKLDLPIPLPITTNQVVRFQPHPFTTMVGGVLTLTNGDKFWQNGYGYIDIYHEGTDFFVEQEFDDMSKYVGTSNMTSNEVVQFARESLRKLGYEPKNMSADGPPTKVSIVGKVNGNTYPFAQVEWEGKEKEKPRDVDKITISVNTETKRVVGLSLLSTNAWRPTPDLGVKIELEADYRKRMKGDMFIRTNAPRTLPANKSP